MKLATASEMRQLDQSAIEEHHIPGMVLMENAGRGTVDFMIRQLGPVTGKSVIIFIGPGNNGGDGLVIARYIYQLGGCPFLVYLFKLENLKGDAAHNFQIISKLDLPCRIVNDKLDLKSVCQEIRSTLKMPVWSIIDAMFGTGLKRPVKGLFLAAVNSINDLSSEGGIPVTAVDIPSGLDSDTGMPLGGGVKADLTVTYGLAKPGHFMHGGSNLIGKLHIVDIGIPPRVVKDAGLCGEALDNLPHDLFTSRKTNSHKGSYGHLFILAGSEGKTGAAILCAHSALRIGTGLVTLAVPARLNPVFESALIEAMTVPLFHSKTYLTSADYDFIMNQLPGKTAVAIGPGIGVNEETGELVSLLYRNVKLPMVVDADALNILADNPEIMIDPPAPRILTPHPGEMARLTGISTKKIQADRIKTACQFAERMNKTKANVTVILKGAGTVISDPGSTWAVNTSGNPGMAAAGMGDVLTGLTAGLLAQGNSPWTATRAGVYLHGLSADRLAVKMRYGYLASEVADTIPELITKMLQ